MDWWLPLQGSTYAGPIDGLFTAILIITGIAFVVVEAGVVWFMIRYRRRPGRTARYIHGNLTAEVVWTAIPAVTVVALGIVSQGHWTRIKGRHSVPPDAYPIAIHASQFEWNVTYPGPDGQLGGGDDLEVRNQLHLPVGRNVEFVLTAEDVIHSFWVPVFRLKQDAVPGMTIHAWVQPTRTGEFELACAELCGMGHYRMKARVVVQTTEELDAWLRERALAQEAES
jgi:cytochrome c oxidase subunit 2